MNNRGYIKKNNYFRPALYIKLIVDNVKYRGIQCDFGRLINLFFVTPDSLLIAFQRDTDFFQYTFYGPASNPTQKGVLNKAGFAVQKSNMPRIRHEWHGENVSCIQDAPCILNSVSGPAYFPGRPLKENSTVFQLIKSSAKKITLIAEGRISGSQAKRACLTIRLFNN